MRVYFRGNNEPSKLSDKKLSLISLGFGIEEIETSKSLNDLVSSGFFRKLKLSMGILESHIKSTIGISCVKTELPCVVVTIDKDNSLPAILKNKVNLRKKLRENTHHLFGSGNLNISKEPIPLIKLKELYKPKSVLIEEKSPRKVLSFLNSLTSIVKLNGETHEDRMFSFLNKNWFKGEFKDELRNWVNYFLNFEDSHPLDISSKSIRFFQANLAVQNKKGLFSNEFVEKLNSFFETREKEKERKDFFKFIALESYTQEQLFSVVAKTLYVSYNSCNEWQNNLLELYEKEKSGENERAIARLMATMTVLDVGQGVCSQNAVNIHLSTGTVGDYLNIQKEIDDLYHQRTGKNVEKSRYSWKRKWDDFDVKQKENVGKLMASIALYAEPENKEDVYKLFHSLVNQSIRIKKDIDVKDFNLITINLESLKIPLFQREVTRNDDPRIFLNTLIDITQKSINAVTGNDNLLDEILYKSLYINDEAHISGVFTLDRSCDFYLGEKPVNVNYLIEAIHMVLPDISQELYLRFKERNISGNIISYKEFVPKLTIKYTETLLSAITKLEIDANFDKIAKEQEFDYKDDEDVPDCGNSGWKI